jgi:hypothetical protein
MGQAAPRHFLPAYAAWHAFPDAGDGLGGLLKWQDLANARIKTRRTSRRPEARHKEHADFGT